MGGAVSSGKDNNELIDNLMSGNYIRSREVERVFRALDRAEYMTPEAREQAYKDLAWRNGPLHLSSPCIYSEVMEGLELKPGLSFLNIGAGTGYLSTLVGLILGSSGISHGVEVHPAVVEYATKKINLFFENSPVLDDFDFCEPKFYHGNGLCLSQLQSGYDRVYCGAGCPEQYESYFKKLIKVGGILVMPLNDTLLQVRRVSVDKWTSKSLLSVSFATLRIPSSEEASEKIKLDKQAPVRLQFLARAVVREAMRRGVARRHPELLEKPRPPPQASCPRRICIPIESGGSVEGLNVLHDLDNDNGANEMNALLSLVISMGQSRVAGALRFDRISSSEDEDDDNRDQDNHNQDEGNPNQQQDIHNQRQDNDNQQQDSHNQQQDSQNQQQSNHSLSQDNDNHNQDNDNHSQDNHNQSHAKNNSQNSCPEQSPPDNPEPTTRRKHLSDSESDRMLYSDAYMHSLMQNIDPAYLSETSDYELAMPGVLRKKADKPGEPSFIVPSGNKTNTAIETNVGTPATCASGSDEANNSLHNNQETRPGKPGNLDTPVDRNRRPRAKSSDERPPVSRKSGRKRWTRISSPPRDDRPSTSSEKCKKTPNTTGSEEAADNVATSQDPRGTSRPDLPGMPSEVEIDLGKVAQTDANAASVSMEWEETSADNLEGSEDEVEPSKSKPKRQKLDSGIGESTPTGSSPEKSKSENSDDDSRHSDCISEEGSNDGSGVDADGSSFLDDNYDSDIESDADIDYFEERLEDNNGSRPWSPSREDIEREEQEAERRRAARHAADARRLRFSCLMKQAANELPLPHPLKRFVNLGRCFDC